MQLSSNALTLGCHWTQQNESQLLSYNHAVPVNDSDRVCFWTKDISFFTQQHLLILSLTDTLCGCIWTASYCEELEELEALEELLAILCLPSVLFTLYSYSMAGSKMSALSHCRTCVPACWKQCFRSSDPYTSNRSCNICLTYMYM